MNQTFLKSQIKNWETLTEKSQECITNAFEEKKDAINFLTQDIQNLSIDDTIQYFQSLADREHSGEARSKADWGNIIASQYKSIADNIEPYEEDLYLSHALRARPATIGHVFFPLLLNHDPKEPVFNGERKCSHYKDLLDLYESKLGYKLHDQNYYGMNFKQERNDIYLSKDSEFNEYEKIILINSFIAKQALLNNRSKFLTESFKDGQYGPGDITLIENVAHKLLALGLMRATDLGNAEISYKIDEALKLQIANALCLLQGKNKDVSRFITFQLREILTEIIKSLGLNKNDIYKNILNMGLSYSNSPTNLYNLIFGPNNLKKCFNISDEKILASHSAAVINNSQLSSTLKAKITGIKTRLPGYIEYYLLTESQKKEFFEKDDNNIIRFTLGKNISNYSDDITEENSRRIAEKFAIWKVNKIKDTVRLVSNLGESSIGISSKKLLNMTLNEEYPKKHNSEIIKDKFYDIVDEIIKDDKPDSESVIASQSDKQNNGKDDI
jgi:hypothetical protein